MSHGGGGGGIGDFGLIFIVIVIFFVIWYLAGGTKHASVDKPFITPYTDGVNGGAKYNKGDTLDMSGSNGGPITDLKNGIPN